MTSFNQNSTVLLVGYIAVSASTLCINHQLQAAVHTTRRRPFFQNVENYVLKIQLFGSKRGGSLLGTNKVVIREKRMLRTRRRYLASKLRNVSADRNGSRMIDERGTDFRQGWDVLEWRCVEWIRKNGKAPLVLKGLAAQEDAFRAVDAGTDGIIMPNHGDCRLDSGYHPSTCYERS